jgi:hypothetical protein
MTADDRQYQHDMRVWENEVARRLQVFGIHTSAIIGFATLTINSIILANSAAAGAVLAFFATMWGDPGAADVLASVVKCIKIFAVGVFAAMTCGGFSYIAQYCYASAEDTLNNGIPKKLAKVVAVTTHLLALVAAIAGIVSFAVGAYYGIDALQASNAGLPK